MENETHKCKLSLLCFVCGDFFKIPFCVRVHAENLKRAFYVDVSSLDDEIHRTFVKNVITS